MADGTQAYAGGAQGWAPDGCSCDNGEPGGCNYKQGDGDVPIHDWTLEETLSGVVMQALRVRVTVRVRVRDIRGDAVAGGVLTLTRMQAELPRCPDPHPNPHPNAGGAAAGVSERVCNPRVPATGLIIPTPALIEPLNLTGSTLPRRP